MHGHLNVRIVDDVQRNYPKHVEFYSKIKFENLVNLVGFIIRIIDAFTHILSLRDVGRDNFTSFLQFTVFL